MEQTCVTESKLSVFNNLWKIRPFSTETSREIKSDIFYGYSSHSDIELSWHYVLKLSISGARTYGHFAGQYNSDYSVSIMIVVDSCNIPLNFIVELANHGTSKITGTTALFGPKPGEITISSEKMINYFLLNDTVTFNLKFSLIENANPPDSKFVENYTSLLTNEQLSDFTLQVGEEKFYAQKAILSVRCPYFEAMFQSGMKESEGKCLTVRDVEPDVFREVMRFIYTDKVRGLETMAHELLAAADRFSLDKLRAMCARHLRWNLTRENVLQTLVLADMHHAKKLKGQAIRFVCEQVKTMNKADWEGFCSERPDLAAAIFSAMAGP